MRIRAASAARCRTDACRSLGFAERGRAGPVASLWTGICHRALTRRIGRPPETRAPLSAMTTVATLLEKLASTDKDLRHMATSDLIAGLDKNASFVVEPRYQVRGPL